MKKQFLVMFCLLLSSGITIAQSQKNGESFEPTLTKGEIAFTSYAGNLVEGVDAAAMINVYWRSLHTGRNNYPNKNQWKLLTVQSLLRVEYLRIGLGSII